MYISAIKCSLFQIDINNIKGEPVWSLPQPTQSHNENVDNMILKLYLKVNIKINWLKQFHFYIAKAQI